MNEHFPRPEGGLALLPAAWIRKRAPTRSPQATARIRAAKYQRYSDKMQLETSIERQSEDSDAYIARHGWELAGDWSDRARGGTHIVGRDGLLAMLEAARRREFDRLVVEDIDRLGRDLGILGTVHRELSDLGIEIHGTRQGRQLDASDVAVRGLQAQETRSLLLYRTQKGRDKAARLGKTSRISWGFKRGANPGEREPIPEIAAVIREMYEMRVAGLTCGGVADVLNRRGVRTQGGGLWTASGVSKLLANPAYKGLLVYKRTKCFKPLDGRRVVEARPVTDWIITEVEGWSVVPEATWRAAQPPPTEGRATWQRKQFLLSRRVQCPACGGTLQASADVNRPPNFQCITFLKTKMCRGFAVYCMATVEREVLDIVRAQLLDPGLEAEYVLGYEAARRREERRVSAERAALTGRLAELDRLSKASFLESLTKGMASEAVVQMRLDWNEETQELRRKLFELPGVPANRMLAPERLASLRAAFDAAFEQLPFRPRDEAGHLLMAAFRDIVKAVTIQPDGIGRGYRLSVETCLPAVLTGDSAPAGEPLPNLVVQSRWISGRTKGTVSKRELEFMKEVADSGRLDMDDRIWAIIEPLVPERVRRRIGMKPLASARPVVDALFFALRTGYPLYRPPERYGPPAVTLAAIRRLVYHGGWDAIVAALRDEAPEFLDGVELDVAESFREPKRDAVRDRADPGRPSAPPSPRAPSGGASRATRAPAASAAKKRRRRPAR